MDPLTVPSLLRFSIGVSRIGIRHGSHIARYKAPQPEKSGFWPGHGEKIWVHAHIMSGQVIYSTTPQLDGQSAEQLPFNGKKTKPAKLRKDYWKPMAIIQFPEGAGVVGRSVFQKLRELRRAHELEWGYQTDKLYGMSKKDRGQELNDQRANSVADMAAALSGLGRGNLIHISNNGSVSRPNSPLRLALDAARPSEPVEVVLKDPKAEENVSEDPKAEEQRPEQKLWPATIHWANSWDRTHAQSWPENVTHELGWTDEVNSAPGMRFTVAKLKAQAKLEKNIQDLAAADPSATVKAAVTA